MAWYAEKPELASVNWLDFNSKDCY